MPRPNNTSQIVNKRASITFTDYKGRTLSQSIKTNGGDLSFGDVTALAEAIADCSNACFSRIEDSHEESWRDSDLRFYDDAEASVESVIVVVLLHDTDASQNREVLIPAYDASMLIASSDVVDITNPSLLAVVNAALSVANDDDNPLTGDVYHDWRAYTTTRRSSSKRSKPSRVLPVPTESGSGDNPPDLPGEMP